METADLFVSTSAVHGRGVVAGREFREGEVLEDCPVLVLDHDEMAEVGATALSGHLFDWGEGGALALGHTSLLNHSFTPNAAYDMDYERLRITVRAIRSISRGEEITINYGGAPDARTDLWFEAG